MSNPFKHVYGNRLKLGLPSNFIRTAEKLKHEKQHFVVE
jgi:hypothetical protein